MTLLNEWASQSRTELEAQGFTVTMPEQEGRCTSVNIDSDKVIGTICFWEPNQFEFQFNSPKTGDVLALVSVELSNVASVSECLKEVMSKIRP
ncbi:immunity protein TriTu family protein [Methylomonas methanica]|uniref:Uncharacterized protein n=1 Tax=Methylomonas methanica (strain DSM 25384 / MC09) TaxID=857087 RepID=G0A707_METMM|nr:hypothetical protein [Methylomonas methanica]AEG01801.1 hypothetical protein Metme_3432 [Methylomonas methanica MC09]